MKRFLLSILAFLSPILFVSCDCDIDRLLIHIIVGGGDLSCTIDGVHYERTDMRISSSFEMLEDSDKFRLKFGVPISTSRRGEYMSHLNLGINDQTPLEINKKYELFSPQWSLDEFPCYSISLGYCKCLGGWVEFQEIDYPRKPGNNTLVVKGTFEADALDDDGTILHIRNGTFAIPCTMLLK